MVTRTLKGIDNLALVGAWSFPGGGQSAVILSGINAARDIHLLGTLAGLRDAGVAKAFIGGRFVSTKPVPGDVDILFRKGHPFKWNPFIRTARRAYAQDIHIYNADRRSPTP